MASPARRTHASFRHRPLKADGLRRIAFWRERVVKSGLACCDQFLKLLDTWQDLIANDFINHQTRGFVEGLNNRLKMLKRRCYGIRNIGRIVQCLTLDVEGYRCFSPWPATTHEIWAPSRQFLETLPRVNRARSVCLSRNCWRMDSWSVRVLAPPKGRLRMACCISVRQRVMGCSSLYDGTHLA
ncbi:MAG: transposase [Chloroflexi bacterium]|nr:transposase [Chloroflexota bacterium]